jgi:ATP-binding cassette subfamily F protein 3
MLTAHHLSKSFDSQPLFEDVTFSLNPAERVGLIGPNGCGKTTLLRILVGLETPSAGQVEHAPNLHIGYLPQGFDPAPEDTLGAIVARHGGNAEETYAELESVATSLARRPTDPALQNRYDELVARLASSQAGRAAQVLAGLGLEGLDPDLPARYLSGGQKTRLGLALVLLDDPHLLLLDEPTNHLDIRMLEWLESWLVGNPCGMLIVSHDRTFLDHTVTRILELDPQRGLHAYAGSYSDYLAQRQVEIDRQWTAYKDQQMEIKRLKADIARAKAQAAYTERQASSVRIGGSDMKIKGFKDYQRSIAKKVARKAKARETRLDHYLESDERVDKPQRSWQMKMEFGETPHLGRTVLHLEDLSAGYDPGAPLLQGVTLDLRAGQRIVLSGPNGSGKTTLLRTIARQIPPLKGQVRLGSSVRLGYMTQDGSSLDPALTALETVAELFPNETEARNYLSFYLLTGDEPLKPVAMLSYGQRARLMLARLVAQGCNLLLLDEPINHLDIPSRTQFESALNSFNGAVLAVLHDRYFIERFADETWWVEAHGIQVKAAG